MRRIALVINTDKPMAVTAGREIAEWLLDRSIQPLFQTEGAVMIGRPELAETDLATWGSAELLIVLGGDGTLIRAAKTVAPMQVPVLGINTGHLGFLTEIECSELFDHLEGFLEGRYQIEERVMLNAAIERDGRILSEMTALNDAVVAKGPKARLVRLEVSVGNTRVARYPADGVIIATPTGSTAYSLSAGGPVVAPTVDVILITPICPHTMNSRAIVVAGTEEVKVLVTESGGEAGLSVDGAELTLLKSGDIVRVMRSPYTAKLVRRHGYQFYDVLRRKLANPGNS